MTGQRTLLRPATVACATAFMLALALAPATTLAQAGPAATAPQSSNNGGVTVKVTPTTIGKPGLAWEFQVVFDSHSSELTDDVMKTATLTLADGRKLKPVRWTGPGPGGHHREGSLGFDVVDAPAGAVELSITRPGEAAPRIFRWQP